MGGQALKSSRHDAKASIALVGLQGAGKRTLGFIAASHLRGRLLLECAHFEENTGLSKASYMRKHGRECFHSKAIELLRSMLNDFGEGSVIVCGVTSLVPGATSIMSDFARNHPVIHVRRDLRMVPIENRSTEAEQLHAFCSNLEYFNLDQADASHSIASPELRLFTLTKVQADFERFLVFITPQPGQDGPGHFDLDALPVERRNHSTVVTYPMSDILNGDAIPALEESTADAIEVRVDWWDELARQGLGRCIGLIRRATRTPILLLFGATYGMNIQLRDADYFQALTHGIRFGVEYMVVRSDLIGSPQPAVLESRGATKIVAHHHFHDEIRGGWLTERRMKACVDAQQLGYDAVRLTQDSVRRQDNYDVSSFLHKVATLKHISIPVSAYNAGPVSKPSKISNAALTPVAQSTGKLPGARLSLHENITIRDIVSARFSNYDYDALSFWVLGTHVSASLTPTMSQAAYDYYGMRHAFTRHFAPSFDEVLSLARDPCFGGGAITTPFKEQAFQTCVDSSPHATAIGAVNTILPLRRLEDGKGMDLAEQALQRNRAGPVIGLYGDNSDWYGIYANVKRQLSPRNAVRLSQSTGLVMGAGGSARSAVYALMRCGLDTICIYNRTKEKATSLADHFRAWGARNGYETRLEILTADFDWPNGLQYPTVIVSCVPSRTIEMPAKLLDSVWGGVVADMCYAPPNAPLHHQVKQAQSLGQRQWSLVHGIDILLESCVLQFEQMTGYKAPRAVTERALRTVDMHDTS